MKYTKEELSIIWLNSILGLEYKHVVALLDSLLKAKTMTEFLEDNKDYILSNLGEGVYSSIKASLNNDYLNFVLKELASREITAITIKSKNYPSFLANIDIPPIVLYCKGNIDLLTSNCFSIVGSRKSLPLSINLAREYASSLGKHFTLVTGIAEGVDSEVLKTALETKANVISISAGGFDNVYPKSNSDLFKCVSEKGLVISEYPPQVVAKPYFFPLRNRLIAGLSRGILIVNGGLKSGTLYTAEYGLAFGKDVFAIPYSVGVASGAGNNELIKNGVTLTDKVDDILSFYNLTEKEERIEISFSNEEREIIELLADGSLSVDKLSEKTNKQVYEIMPTLSMLEIKGIIVKNGFNIYALAKALTED